MLLIDFSRIMQRYSFSSNISSPDKNKKPNSQTHTQSAADAALVLFHRDSLDGTEFTDGHLAGIALVIDLAGAAAAHLELATIDVTAHRSRAHDATRDIGRLHFVGLYFARAHQSQ